MKGGQSTDLDSVGGGAYKQNLKGGETEMPPPPCMHPCGTTICYDDDV